MHEIDRDGIAARMTECDANHDDRWHLHGIRSAFVREWLGGVKAEESLLFERSYKELIKRGYSVQQIVDGVRALNPTNGS